jgi:hypothetical protein
MSLQEPLFQELDVVQVIGSPFKSIFLLSFNGSNGLLLHQKVEPGVGSVVESMGQDFCISFSLQLLISWLAPSWRLDLTNGLAGDHSALRFSSVSGIDQDLLIDRLID